VTVERRLALAALALGIGAALVGNPIRAPEGLVRGAVGLGGSGADLGEIAAAAVEGRDRVSAFELARWIRDRDPDLRIVDLRSREAFEEFTIPQADWVPLDSLVATAIEPSSSLVLVSADGDFAAQAWVMARLMGHRNAWVLEGGVLAWIQEVLTPIVPATLPDEDSAYWESVIEMARYYGGEPRRVLDPMNIPPPRAARDPDTLIEELVQEARDLGCGW